MRDQPIAVDLLRLGEAMFFQLLPAGQHPFSPHLPAICRPAGRPHRRVAHRAGLPGIAHAAQRLRPARPAVRRCREKFPRLCGPTIRPRALRPVAPAFAPGRPRRRSAICRTPAPANKTAARFHIGRGGGNRRHWPAPDSRLLRLPAAGLGPVAIVRVGTEFQVFESCHRRSCLFPCRVSRAEPAGHSPSTSSLPTGGREGKASAHEKPRRGAGLAGAICRRGDFESLDSPVCPARGNLSQAKALSTRTARKRTSSNSTSLPIASSLSIPSGSSSASANIR